jgi:hypothetical protein
MSRWPLVMATRKSTKISNIIKRGAVVVEDDRGEVRQFAGKEDAC